MGKTAQKPEVVRSETKFNIKLGEYVYTLNFNTNTFLRIKDAKPELTTAFHAVEEIPPYELIPFLIHCAIKPEERKWTSFAELADLYDDIDDQEAIAKILPAFMAATGAVTKKIQPALEAVVALHEREK
jgi:hypothetical protein